MFDRFPDLRVLMAENQIGWVPTFMTVAGERYNRYPHSAKVLEENFASAPDEDTYRMVCGSAVDFFHLEDIVAPLGTGQR